ncbi:MAG: iron complex outermembrane receptor protein [Halioglobus sp.]|jgi:iron complex outermembrane receptor protein
MKKRTLMYTCVATAVFGCGTSINSLAQEVERASPNAIFEEILVTAQKREQSIYEVPVAISAFSNDALEKQGITNLSDVGKFVPNLNVTGFGGGQTSSANPFIRGIGLQDHLITTDPGVGVYVDGVYLGRQVGQNWSLSNIERIEVLRGPQGTLYGRNSIGGAINIITQQPGDEDIAKIGLQVGSRERVNGDFYGNVALTETFAMSVSGSFQRRGGIGEFKNLPNAKVDVGEMQDISARIAAKWQPTDRFSVLVVADGSDGSNGLRPYTTLIDELPNGAVYAAGYRNSDLAKNKYDNNTGQEGQTEVTNEASGVAITAAYEINDDLAAKLIVSDRHSEYQTGLDDDGFFDDFLSFPERGEADQTSIELQLVGQYDDWDFVTGLYYFEEEGSNIQDPTVFNGGLGDFLLGQEMDSTAIYANLGYQMNDRLHISGGVRYTEDKKTANTNLNSSLIVEKASREWDEVSWELATTWAVNDDLTAYATIQNGYQSGQFPPRPFCLFGSLDFTQPGNVSRPNCFEANDNITAINYEGGIKGTPLENLQVSISVFYTEYSDLPYQVSNATSAGFNTRNIIVDQESSGVEWESTWALGDRFRLRTSLGYIDVEVDDNDAVAPLTPELTASISPEYTLPLDGGADITFRADWSYRDDMYGEPTSDSARFTGIESRSLLNFDIAYHSADADWTIALYGRNVTDERYDEARLNTGDYVLVMLSNDASEFGLRFTKEF